jgi:transposase-like protein
MNIVINETLRAYIDPLTEDEYAALERSLLAEGCRDALVLWNDILVDGHNRYSICRKHDIPFQTVQNKTFQSLDDVYLWMIDNHLGRRSVSDFQRGVLALRKKEILAARAAQPAAEEPSTPETPAKKPDPVPPLTRQAAARAARVSSATLTQIEKIQKTAAPELVSAIKSGDISISAAAAVASLPSEKQVEAVAGGRKELRQVARQVRESRLPPKPEVEPPPPDATPEQREIHRLKQQVAELSEERDQLKKKVQQLTIALAEERGK